MHNTPVCSRCVHGNVSLPLCEMCCHYPVSVCSVVSKACVCAVIYLYMIGFNQVETNKIFFEKLFYLSWYPIHRSMISWYKLVTCQIQILSQNNKKITLVKPITYCKVIISVSAPPKVQFRSGDRTSDAASRKVVQLNWWVKELFQPTLRCTAAQVRFYEVSVLYL